VRQRRARTGWFTRKHLHPAAPNVPPSTKATAPEPPVRRDDMREPARNESAMLEALRQARERTRGRIE
jgi:hypothetical protein